MINNDTERLRQGRLAPKVLKAKLSAKRMKGSCKYLDIMKFMILRKSIVCHNHRPGRPVTWQSIGLPFIENKLSKVFVCRGLFTCAASVGIPGVKQASCGSVDIPWQLDIQHRMSCALTTNLPGFVCAYGGHTSPPHLRGVGRLLAKQR